MVKAFGDAKVLKYGAWLSILGLILIEQAPTTALMILSNAVFMIGNSLMGPTSSSLATKGSTKNQGASLGVLQSFGSLGRILGPVTGGFLYSVYEGLPFFLAAAIILIAILVGSRRIMEFEKVVAEG